MDVEKIRNGKEWKEAVAYWKANGDKPIHKGTILHIGTHHEVKGIAPRLGGKQK